MSQIQSAGGIESSFDIAESKLFTEKLGIHLIQHGMAKLAGLNKGSGIIKPGGLIPGSAD